MARALALDFKNNFEWGTSFNLGQTLLARALALDFKNNFEWGTSFNLGQTLLARGLALLRETHFYFYLKPSIVPKQQTRSNALGKRTCPT